MSRAVADVLLGKYKAKRMTQKDIAQATGIPEVTLRKKIAGESPISVHELVLISGAIGTTPQQVLDEALEAVAGMDALSAATGSNVVQLRKHPRDMTAAELDAYEGDRAAHAFDEEADAPDE